MNAKSSYFNHEPEECLVDLDGDLGGHGEDDDLEGLLDLTFAEAVVGPDRVLPGVGVADAAPRQEQRVVGEDLGKGGGDGGGCCKIRDYLSQSPNRLIPRFCSVI